MDSRQHFTFTDTPSMNVGSARTPLDYFKLLFNNTFINFIVSSINMNAIKILMDQPAKCSEFIPTDGDEVYTLLAVYFLMGYIKVNQSAFYWNAPISNLKFENYISKDRFVLLMRALAFRSKLNYDDNGDSMRSWYDAAKPLVDLFNLTMKSLTVPDKELNIDKCTAHWFNELNFMRKKPERIRMHLLSDKSGIFHRVYLCHPDGKNKGEEIAMSLMKDFIGSGRSLYACPFYTSVSLAEKLLESKTYLTGILKRKRYRNPTFVKKKLKIGSVKSLFNDKGVCVCNVRKTNNTILGLSTEHSPQVDKHCRSGNIEILSRFKENMDMFKRNQTISVNSPCDTKKKYNHNIQYLLQAMFMNTFLMFNANQASKMPFSDFRKAILYEYLPLPSEDVITDSDEDTDASVNSTDQRPVEDEVIHMPSQWPVDKRRTRHCRNCWLQSGIRKNTKFFCPQCPQKWGLCLDCFREFHNY